MTRRALATTLLLAACGGRVHVDGAATELRPLDGPYATIDAYCRAELERRPAPSSPAEDADTHEPDAPAPWCASDRETLARLDGAVSTAPIALGPPFLAAQVVGVGDDASESINCRLLVQVASGWYVLPLADCFEDSTRTRTIARLNEVALRELFAGRPPVLVVRYTVEQVASNMDNDGWHFETQHERARVCGVGPSGKPSCTPEIELMKSWDNHPIEGHEPSPELAGQKRERGSQRRTLDTDGDALVVRGGAAPERHVVRFP